MKRTPRLTLAAVLAVVAATVGFTVAGAARLPGGSGPGLADGFQTGPHPSVFHDASSGTIDPGSDLTRPAPLGHVKLPGKVAFIGPPHIGDYSNSGCLDSFSDDGSPCEADDEVALTVDGHTLHVLHASATYNCCPDDIVVSLSIEGSLLRLTETEILTLPCDCNCCYDVEATVVDLAPGQYTVEFCWQDYEWGAERCHTEDIVIPARETTAPTDGEPAGPGATDCQRSAPLTGDIAPQLDEAGPGGPPYIADYSDTGCLLGSLDRSFPCDEDDAIELTVVGYTLRALHTNATYNCCADEIAVSLAVEGSLIKLTETEIVPMPCWCICCYNVEATVVDLPAGEYTVEYCWFDYETWDERCYWEDIVVPPGGRTAGTGGGSPISGSPLGGPVDPDHGSMAAQLVPGSAATSSGSSPSVSGYSNSGCQPPESHSACEDLDEVVLAVDGSTLHVLHSNATYNCCADDIVFSVSAEGGLISLIEEEVLPNPCYCICCYEVEATVVDLAPGAYTVEFCWFDYETWAEQCYWEDIVIEYSGGSGR